MCKLVSVVQYINMFLFFKQDSFPKTNLHLFRGLVFHTDAFIYFKGFYFI